MKLTKLVTITLALALSIAAAAQATKQDGAVTTTRLFEPEKKLVWDVDIPAPIEQVWEAMTTEKGLTTWITPTAKVELRKGGDWLAMWPGAAPGGGTIVDFVPGKSLSLRAMAPEKFPTVRRERTLAVFEFSPIDDKNTHVRLTQTGWKQGKEWDDAYDYLAWGNAYMMNGLRERFVKGPVDWEAAAKAQQQKAAR